MRDNNGKIIINRISKKTYKITNVFKRENYDSANLELCPLSFNNRENPYLDSNKEYKTVELVLNICNNGQSTAINILDTVFTIMKINNHFHKSDSIATGAFSTFDVNIYPNNSIKVYYPIFFTEGDTIPTVYCYFKFIYTDKNKKNKTLRGIYDLTATQLKTYIDLPIPKVSDYLAVKQYLKSINCW